jgi:hypothetical protein
VGLRTKGQRWVRRWVAPGAVMDGQTRATIGFHVPTLWSLSSHAHIRFSARADRWVRMHATFSTLDLLNNKFLLFFVLISAHHQHHINQCLCNFILYILDWTIY